MIQSYRKEFAAGLTVGGLAVVGLVAMLAASPAPQKEATASTPPDPEAAASQAKPLSPAAEEVEGVRGDVESLDAQVQDGLKQMGRYLKEFEAERRTWVSLDLTVDAARRVNLALLARNRAVLSLYDKGLSEPLERFKERLKEAPAAYRRLAEERRKYAAEATLETERTSYEQMASLCESAARLCEQRYREVFDGDSGQPNAVTLAETIANMRKYELVHARWEDTFARYPSSLDDRRMAALFSHLSVYAEDLETFTQRVEALSESMRRKADGQAARPNAGATSTDQGTTRETPGRVARGGRVSDILRRGAVFEGSFDTGRSVIASRIVILRRTGDDFTARLSIEGSGGHGESEVRGIIRDTHVTMECTRLAGHVQPRFTCAARIEGATLAGDCVVNSRPASTFTFTLAKGDVPPDRLAVAVGR